MKGILQQHQEKNYDGKKLHRKIKKLGNENFFILYDFFVSFFLYQVHIFFLFKYYNIVLDLVYLVLQHFLLSELSVL